MSDRLKRRKKTAEESKGEAKPAPLQPAYFDKETATDKPTGADSHEINTPQQHSRNAEPRAPKTEVAPSEQHRDAYPVAVERDSQSTPRASTGEPKSPEANQGSDSSDLQRRRRRRGRGGRGRGRSAPAQPVIAAAPGIESPRPAHAEGEQLGPASVPNQPTEAAAPRASKGTVVLAIGLPGSGKSSWFKRHQISPLSSDLLRALLFDDPTEQRFQDLVFSNLRSMLKARLIARRPMNYVDATNLTPHERGGWIKLAKDYGYEVQAVFFDVPLETCLERNHKRQRVVSDDVMRRMSGKLKPPTFEEGFSKITVVRVKQKE
ncbi:MAG TPA: AAA family ATPase [Terriglobales bacterium]|nr:AAA family ATPase [Terriglobales bacterium]